MLRKFSALFICFVLLVASKPLFAQGCAVCSKTASSVGGGDAGLKGLNAGILYLAAIPLIFIGTIAIIWFKRNKTTGA